MATFKKFAMFLKVAMATFKQCMCIHILSGVALCRHRGMMQPALRSSLGVAIRACAMDRPQHTVWVWLC
eukprot:1625165-Lingulodinium_polyedra.AAC.1